MVSSESAFTFTASPLDCHLERGNSSLLSIGTGSEPQDWSSCYQYFTSIKASHGLEGLYVPPEHVCSHWLLIQPSRDWGCADRHCRTRGRAGPLAELGGTLVELDGVQPGLPCRNCGACSLPLQNSGAPRPPLYYSGACRLLL